MNNVSPFPTGLKYGVILALISILITVIIYVAGFLTNPAASSILGMVSLITYIAVIALAIKSHRDAKQNGYITLGQAIGVGIITALVSAVIGGIFNYILYAFIDPGLMEELITMQEDSMAESGMPEEQLEMVLQYVKMFTNPGMQIVSSLCMGSCCGGIVSLIAGLILKNEPLQDNTF